MRKAALSLIAVGMLVTTSAFAANAVRISQLGGGGGAPVSVGYYTCDYVELFNNSGQPVNIGGWSVQFGAAASTNFAVAVNSYAFIPAGTVIPPCGYYLIQGQCSADGGGQPLPVTPDLVAQPGDNWGPPSFTPVSAKCAIFPDTVRLRTCVQALADAVDLVGYGTANCYEAAAAPAGNAQSAIVRAMGGALDCDFNQSDFTVEALPYPLHNSLSAPNPDCGATCPPVPAISDTWGRLKTIYR